MILFSVIATVLHMILLHCRALFIIYFFIGPPIGHMTCTLYTVKNPRVRT